MSESWNADQIRLRMAILRDRMDDEFDEVIENAQVLGDWKFYVRKYPWICLAGAAVVGYAVVPSRPERPVPSSEVVSAPADGKEHGDTYLRRSTAQGSGSPAFGGSLKPMVVRMLMRAAVSYAGRKLGEYLTDVPDGRQADGLTEHAPMDPA